MHLKQCWASFRAPRSLRVVCFISSKFLFADTHLQKEIIRGENELVHNSVHTSATAMWPSNTYSTVS